ncbi:2-oxoglutarate dehydrogenase complex dihydrolipoyllysine-residue succinyltransferase [Allochromatium humboldtianum]|uniref:Dihydrolipoyllysine-residue succinyltransferase component of 2-oxoglutarate dehydrogenase complex n=1 Tax=Allochromatium humboldtianum TaxID=504901 RepID=A0A850REP7_9GAMM|nr:2-oxoglutarate dehydrogenase complex dihydrolipoyllysine-residue succinyltransferase [Allochromatium humboldtianum]NVZ10696.1 2-oxoglutarate dehydrogenase complex dihydrolipoyllysine-residue succinyltransferase [Allochromatium humboldtianum]
MSLEVRVPALPESVADARVLTWSKRPGEAVREGENLVELETDKVVLEVPAPRSGVLSEILAAEGAMVHTDDVLALISEGAVSVAPAPKPASTPSTAPTATPTPPAAAPQPNAPPHVTPSARQLVKELHLEPSQIPSRDGRIQKADVLAYLDAREGQAPERHPDLAAAPATQTPVEPALAPTPALSGEAGRPEQRVPMTRLRARIAERLLQAQQNAALLTTFNEVNLSAVNALRARYKETFEQRHGVRLGLMSFFVKAAVEALQRFPVLNASIDGEDVLYHGYYDIGIAVSSPRGLVVPILRNADQLGMAEVEQGIADFGQKARDGSLSYEELTGGTFSITNGGVFGSLLSTPILNPPQSAILGLHKIQERPIVENGQIVVAPMMYLALTYDHRLIDGRDAVQFLVAIKELLEDPARLLLRV